MVNISVGDARGDSRGLKKVDIHVGELYVSRTPVVIQTLLGSCVSACLYDPKTKLAGMNHILLPGRASIDLGDDAARYGVNSMEHLINRLIDLGAPRKRLTAKIFGGGHIIAGIGEEDSPGFKNAEFISRFLEVEKIPVVGRDLGGYQARRIYFHTDTGDVYLKRISVFKTTRQLVEEEKRYRQKVEKEIGRPGSITLFD